MRWLKVALPLLCLMQVRLATFCSGPTEQNVASLFVVPAMLLQTSTGHREGSLCEDRDACYNGCGQVSNGSASGLEVAHGMQPPEQCAGRNGVYDDDPGAK